MRPPLLNQPARHTDRRHSHPPDDPLADLPSFDPDPLHGTAFDLSAAAAHIGQPAWWSLAAGALQDRRSPLVPAPAIFPSASAAGIVTLPLITNSAPRGSVNVSGKALQGQTLKASHTLTDADGLGVIGYQWLADGVVIGGATGSSLVLAQAQVNHKISVRASYRDGRGTHEAVTSVQTAPVVNINDQPTGPVTVFGPPLQGQTLQASHKLADADGLGFISYQWLADGVAISGATGSTLVLAQAQVDHKISVRASYRDGGGTLESVTSIRTPSVINVNDAPQARLVQQTLDEDGKLAFNATSFGFVDAPGENGTLAAVVIRVLPSSGRLTLNGLAVSSGQVVPAAALEQLVYRPADNLNGYAVDRWSFRLRDDGGTALGGVDTSTADSLMSLTLRPVNDAPTSADGSRWTIPNAPLRFAREDFAFTDPTDRPSNALLAVRIVTLPTHGSLHVDGVALTAGQSIAADKLERLTYTAAAGQFGKALDRYTFAVQDDGGTERMGVDISRAYTMTLDVLAPMAPTVTLDPIAGDGVLDRIESGRALLLTGRLAGMTQVLEGHVAASIALSIVDLDAPGQPAIELRASDYASASGLWQASLDPARLTDGHRHQITVTTTGSGGAAGLTATTRADVRVDRTAPTATVTDDVSGSIVTTSVGYTITFSEPVTGFDAADISSPNGKVGSLAWIDARQARFTFTPTDLTQGDNLDVRIGTGWLDAASNAPTAAPAMRTLAWDRLQPKPPGLALADDTGASNTDGITRLGTVKVSGLEAGATWRYTLDGSTWQDGVGSSFILPAGTHAAARVQAQQTDATGHVSASGTNAQAWIVDTTVARPSLQVRQDTGRYGDDRITRDARINAIGLEAESRREISVDAGKTWTTLSGGAFDLPDGTYADGALLIRQVDVAGNISASSAPLQAFTIDTAAPAPTWALVADTGVAADDDITRLGTLRLGIEVGSSWAASIDAGVTWLNGSGVNWTLPEGSYAAGMVRMKQTDLAGNVSAVGISTRAIRVDRSITAPTLSLKADTGSSASDFNTRDGRLSVQGLDAGDRWSWSLDGVTWTNGVGQSLDLPAGQHNVRVRAEDEAGNQAEATPMAICVDTSRPDMPHLVLAEDSGTPGDGRSRNGLIQVTDLDPLGQWEYTRNAGVDWLTGSGTTFLLDVGTYRAAAVQVRQFDRAGNGSVTGQLAADLVIETASGPQKPRLQSSWLDNATGVDVTSSIVLDFGTADLRAVAGLKIRLVDDGGNASDGQAYGLEATTHTQVFDVAGSNVSLSGGRVTVTPTKHLDLASRYHIELDDGAFVDRSSGLASTGWSDASVLNFETVRPAATASAAASWRMGDDGTRHASHAWIDLSGQGDSWSNRVVTIQADGGARAYVCADQAREPAWSALGFDGIGTGNFNVRISQFGADDLLYIDDQGHGEDFNNPDLTLMVAGTTGTTLYYGPGNNETDGLGGQIEIGLAGGLAAFATRAAWQSSLGLSTSPYVIG
ncbi:Ig-like domain-containing protein [Leptothrix sp. BB-4]